MQNALGITKPTLETFHAQNDTLLNCALKYCHVMECVYRRVLDWWPDLLDCLVRNACLHFAYHCYTHTHTSVYSHVFIAVASYRLPTADVHLPLGSRTIPVPHLPASNSNSAQRVSLISSLLPHQPTTELWVWVILRPTVSRPVFLDFKPLLYHLGTDRVENTVHVAVQLLPWKHVCLCIRYLAATVVLLLIFSVVP
jgi:hypothetical protein